MKKFILIFISLIIITQGRMISQAQFVETAIGQGKYNPISSEFLVVAQAEQAADSSGQSLQKRAPATIKDTAKSNSVQNQNRIHRNRRLNDQFIDADGDGINDNRCRGMGLGPCKGRGQKRGGKK